MEIPESTHGVGTATTRHRQQPLRLTSKRTTSRVIRFKRARQIAHTAQTHGFGMHDALQIHSGISGNKSIVLRRVHLR